MFALALGVQQLDDVLPPVVYALLSGLNSATVGVVALAAVQLSEKAIKDKISRLLVIFGACAGLCYSALWYFPILILVGGCVTAVWDLKLRQAVAKAKRRWGERRQARRAPRVAESAASASEDPTTIALPPLVARPNGTDEPGLQRRTVTAAVASSSAGPSATQELQAPTATINSDEARIPPPTETSAHTIRIRTGITIIVAFFGEQPKSSNVELD